MTEAAWTQAIATGVLVLVTWYYVRLTSKAAQAAEKAADQAERSAGAAEEAVEAAARPVVVVPYAVLVKHSKGPPALRFRFRNVGAGPAIHLTATFFTLPEGPNDRWTKGPLPPMEAGGESPSGTPPHYEHRFVEADTPWLPALEPRRWGFRLTYADIFDIEYEATWRADSDKWTVKADTS